MADHRGYSRFKIDKADEEQRVITGVATTPKLDRVFDVVEPEGARYELPLPLLWQHDHLAPVGSVESASVSSKGIRFRARIAKPEPSDPPALRFRLEEAWASVKKGLVRAVSVGFNSLDMSLLETGGLHFREWDWLELSLVTIPANQDATITTIRSILSKHKHVAAFRPDRNEHVFRASDAAKSRKGATNMKLADKIAALQQEKQEAEQTIKSLGSLIEDGSADDDQIDEFDDAAARLKGLSDQIRRLETVERANGSRDSVSRRIVADNAKSASESRGAGAGVASPRTRVETNLIKEPAGIGFARVALVVAGADLEKRDPIAVARQYYSDRDPRVETMLRAIPYLKAAVAGGNTGVADWAGDVATAQDVMGDFLGFLRTQTILGKFGMDGVPALARRMLNTKTNRMTGGLTSFEVGEGAPTPISKGALDQVTLPVREFAGGTVVTKRQLRYANIALETQIRDDLAAAVREVEDKKFIDPALANSITNGLTPISSSGVDADAVRADLQKLIDPIEAANMDPAQVVLIMRTNLARALSLLRTDFGAVREFPNISMRGGSLEDYPVIVSNNVPYAHVIAVHAPSVLYGDEDVVNVESYDNVAIQQDDAPTNNSATGAGAALVSMAQTRSVYIQATHEANWKVGRTNAVTFIDDAAWNGAVSA